MVGNMLQLTCSVQKPTISQNDMGGQDKSWSNRIDSVRCAFRELSADELIRFGKQTGESVYRFYLEATSANKLIILLDRIIYDGRTFEVNSIYNVSGKDRLLHIDTTELD